MGLKITLMLAEYVSFLLFKNLQMISRNIFGYLYANFIFIMLQFVYGPLFFLKTE